MTFPFLDKIPSLNVLVMLNTTNTEFVKSPATLCT